MCNNGQSAAGTLTNNQLQVLITGRFGDGSLRAPSANYYYSANSVEKDIVEYKKNLLGDLCPSEIKSSINKGFKANIIYSIRSYSLPRITQLAVKEPLELLEEMDELGLALWIYDNGSLHKRGMFYNICTHCYSESDNYKIAETLKRKFNIEAIPTIERKKDGREFWYLRVPKYKGAFYVSEVMRKYLPESLHRKCISSETIQKWSKLLEELKSKGVDMKLADFNRSQKIKKAIEESDMSIQDIVRTYMKI